MVWMSMPESSGGTSVPWPGWVVGSVLGSALTCTTLVPVNAVDSTRSARPRGPAGGRRTRSGTCGCTRRAESTNALAAAAPRAQPRGGGRPPDRGPRPARAGVGDPARGRPHVLRRRRPGRGRRVVAAGAARRGVRRRPRRRAARSSGPTTCCIDRQKVCGVLVERVHVRAHGADKPLAVVGIGINVDQTADELPVPTATSLALSGPPIGPHRAVRRGPARPARRGWG